MEFLLSLSLLSSLCFALIVVSRKNLGHEKIDLKAELNPGLAESCSVKWRQQKEQNPSLKPLTFLTYAIEKKCECSVVFSVPRLSVVCC